ncbi:intermembrane transport protein PqiB [Motiliproteus sp. MSK22-1]|uniref:PqiB family protein n=1 Tax=Motiliproteus sp. MSK22-1 TaxID=1897630 RepID=UPI000976060F|nr:MlaD family protein [Motiliproteus sp. MSK22-1]OMH32668.1 hypothetical protein BGP75_14085 [Motiliproteus sp. MSK22-1]
MIDHQDIPEAVVTPKERLSIIWLLPLVAVAIGAWLFYKSQAEADIPVLIHFPTGQGLVAGKTEVRYQGIPIGLVEEFELDTDLDGVVAKVSFDRRASKALKQGTVFWLVKPQVSLKGISGLDTLVSGEYISLRLGEGEPRFQFDALSEPPPLESGDPGLNITLRADTLGSIQYGSPVHYRQLQVGDVQGYELTDDGKEVLLKVNIKEEYAPLVRGNSRFWNNSGVRLKGSLSGLSLQTDSITSLLIGGISFDTPGNEDKGPLVTSGQTLKLYDSFEAADTGVLVKVAFETAKGLEAGVTPVIFKGLKIGTVVKLNFEKEISKVIAEIQLPPEVESRLNNNTRFWLVKPRLGFSGISGLETLLKGNYIQIEPRKGEGGPVFEFEALPNPPVLGPGDPGLNITLSSDTLGSLQAGSPVNYRQLQVGDVQGYELSEDGQQVHVHLNIREEYANLVKQNTRFWNNSGLSLKGGLSGLSLKTDSLSSLLIGGINFDIANGERPGQNATSGSKFKLYNNFEDANTGVLVRVRFESAEGLNAGVTAVRLQGLDIGKVTRLEMDDKQESVIATVKLPRQTARRLSEDTRFWMVKPEISLSGISGLETLIKGNYIEMDLGKKVKTASAKSAQRLFSALKEPPRLDYSTPGLHLRLFAQEAKGLSRGTPVYYRQIQVGSIQSVKLVDSGQQVAIDVHIAPSYSSLINHNTRFWNTSGLAVTAGLGGVKIESAPLKAMLGGGIAFDTPGKLQKSSIKNGTQFRLHPDRQKAMDDGLQIKIRFSKANGLAKNAPIRYQGFDIGRVLGLTLEPDSDQILVSASIDKVYQYLIRQNSDFWVVKPKLGLTATENLETLVTGGYIQVRPGSGPTAVNFRGLEKEPFLVDGGTGNGNIFILRSDRLGSLKKGSPVYFRQIPVGEVTGFRLSDDSKYVNIHISIESRYAPIVRENTKFWNVSGIDLNFKLFGGAKINTESVESILAGGIAMATPGNGEENTTARAKPGTTFSLYEKAEPEWRNWSPAIALPSR